MKTITLQRLALQNFKGFTFALDAGGSDVDIFGANATGKTTIADAFSWLLFDKDSLGRSDFEIKNLDADGQEEHGLDHSVEGVLSVSGRETTLKKTYRELWTKKRGSAQAIFTGHTTDYFIDGVPVQKKEYVGHVADLAGEESVFRLLTSPTVFPYLHWQKQRALLLEVCGDMTDAEVIDTDASLASLSEILGSRSIDDHRKVIAARRSEINKELEKVPVRIDEVRRSLPDVTGLDRAKLTQGIIDLDKALSDAKMALSGIDNGGNLADLSKQLAAVNSDIYGMEQRYYQEGMAAVAKLNRAISDITFKKGEADRRANGIRGDIAAKEKRIADAEQRLQLLREDWTRADAEEFADTTESVCPACGQNLPADRVQDAREKALAEFNRKKAERLEEITTKGNRLAEDVKREKDGIANLQGLLNQPDQDFGEDKLAGLEAERDAIKAAAEDYSLIPGRADLIAKMSEIEIKIKAEKDGKADQRTGAAEKVSQIEGQLKDEEAKADLFPKREQGMKRIDELKAQEKALAAEYERLEKELYLCEQFIRTKVRILTEKINSRFEVARFKLFEVQVNGGINECCEITVNGIPFNGGLNNAARINAGLDVCRTLSHHFGLAAPIFVDNAESVCRLLNMDAQVVRLVVSDKDAVLRVDVRESNTLFSHKAA